MIQFYLAGPYTNPNPEEIFGNVVRALTYGQVIALARGWLPIVPHVSGPHDDSGERGHAWAEAMDQCIATIAKLRPGTDYLILLPQWRTSRGARAEVKVALALGIEIMSAEKAIDDTHDDSKLLEDCHG